MLLNEVGLSNTMISNKDTFTNRIKNSLTHAKTNYSFNENENTTNNRLWGGTATISKYNNKLIKITQGNDFRGLGRWAWTLTEGIKVKTRIISIYAPTDNEEVVISVSAQHRRYFDSIGLEDHSLDIFGMT